MYERTIEFIHICFLVQFQCSIYLQYESARLSWYRTMACYYPLSVY